MILTDLQFSIAVAEVHAIALAIAPHLAMLTLVGLHPFPVAVDLKFILPNVPEIVLVDIALMIIAADTETARNRAISQYGSHIDARTARIIVVAHLAFILAKEAVAAIISTNLAFQTGLLDEFHHLHKLFVTELEVGLVSCATEWEHREQSPTAYA